MARPTFAPFALAAHVNALVRADGGPLARVTGFTPTDRGFPNGGGQPFTSEAMTPNDARSHARTLEFNGFTECQVESVEN